MPLQPGEPLFALDRRLPSAEFADLVRDRAGSRTEGPAVVAVDGRSGSGKTTLAARLAASFGAPMLHIDDISWNEPLYEWAPIYRDALAQFREAGALAFTPPAWPRHDRAGCLVVPAGSRLLVVEGTGSGGLAVADLVDAAIWVQTDDDVAEERGIGRDIADGTNGAVAESIEFWHWWQAGERPFFAADRPWERADWVVSGVSDVSAPNGQVAFTAR